MVRIHLFVCTDAYEPIYIWHVVRSLTFQNVSLTQKPLGVTRDSVQDDPQLGGKRNELIGVAARKLAETKMIVYDVHEGSFRITDLGRIAAKYYIRHSSIEIFNKEFRPKMSEADILAMLSMSSEVGSPLYEPSK